MIFVAWGGVGVNLIEGVFVGVETDRILVGVTIGLRVGVVVDSEVWSGRGVSVSGDGVAIRVKVRVTKTVTEMVLVGLGLFILVGVDIPVGADVTEIGSSVADGVITAIGVEEPPKDSLSEKRELVNHRISDEKSTNEITDKNFLSINSAPVKP